MTIYSHLLFRARLPLALSIGLVGSLVAHAQIPGQSVPDQPSINVAQSDRGFDATIGKETLHLVVCADSAIHVTTRPDGTATEHPQPWLLPADQSCKGSAFQFSKDAKSAVLKTKTMSVSFSLDRGNLTYSTLTASNCFAKVAQSRAHMLRSASMVIRPFI